MKSTNAAAPLRARLNELRREVHQPTYAEIREFAAHGGDSLSSSTVSDLLRGSGTPRWDTVRKFVLACRRYAERHAREVPASVFDLNTWLADVEALTCDGAASSADRALEWERRCRALVAKWPLPLVSEVDPFTLRVFPSRRAMAYRGDALWPPYAPRDLDERLRHAVRRYPFVLLEGPSRAGKSRTAFESLADAMPRRRLVVPIDRHSLIEIDRLDPPIYRDEAAAVLLDDIERFLSVGSPGLDTDILDRWARTGVTVLATVRFRERERLEKTLGSEVLGVVSAAYTLVLDLDLSAEERRDATRLYPREHFPRGLAEHLAGADELRSTFDRGVENNPAGYAVVRAAADRRRAGLSEAASPAALRGLFDIYYAMVRPIDRPSDEAFADGLRWALAVVAEVSGLLVDSGQVTGAYEVSDVIVDHLDSPERIRPIPTATWLHLLAEAGPGDAVSVGQGAVVRDELDIALQAFESVMRDYDDERGHLAALQLGILLERRGDPDGAELAYRRAMRSAAAEVTPLALTNLAVLLDAKGEEAEARAFLTAVLDGDFADPAKINAGMKLTQILAARGDEAGATATIIATLRRSNAAKVREVALGVVASVVALKGTEGARAFLKSIRDGTDDFLADVVTIMVMAFGPGPIHGLPEVRRRPQAGRGEVRPKAAPELPRTMPAGVKVDVHAEASYQLGQVEESAGDMERAHEAYQQARNEGLAKAALSIARMKAAGGDKTTAELVLRDAARGTDLDVAAQALLSLGQLQESSGRSDEAEATLRRAMNTEHSWVAPAAAALLGRMLLQRKDFRGARAPLEYAAYSDHPPAAALALVSLGSLEIIDNDLVAAKVAFRRVVAMDDGHLGRVAALSIAMLLTDDSNLVEIVNRTLENFTRNDDPAGAAGGSVLVGYLLGHNGEREGAAALLEWAANSGQPSAPSATLFLGTLAQDIGDLDAAETLFRHAIADEDEDVSPEAARLLERLLAGPTATSIMSERH